MKDAIAGLPPAIRKPVWDQIENRLAQATKKQAKADDPVERDIFDRMKEDREVNGAFVPQVEEIISGKAPMWKLWADDQPDTVKYKHVPGGLKALQKEDEFTQADIEETFGKGTTRKAVLDAESMQYARVTGKMRQWFLDHADEAGKPGFEESAEAYRQKLTQPFIVAALSRAVQPTAKAPVNQELLDWLAANPDDPRAPAIRAKAGL
jgi:hypothetical protein